MPGGRRGCSLYSLYICMYIQEDTRNIIINHNRALVSNQNAIASTITNGS